MVEGGQSDGLSLGEGDRLLAPLPLREDPLSL